MSKTIKLVEEVYERLDRIRGKRETFSEVVERCLSVVEVVRGVADTIGPSHYVNDRPITDARAKENIDRRPDRPTLPNVPIR